MTRKTKIQRDLNGRAFEKPPAAFKDDKEIVQWVKEAATKLEPPGDDRDLTFQLACFLTASSIVGPHEDRIASILGIQSCQAAFWARNLRRNGLWHDGRVASESWHDEQNGLVHFILASLVADGLTETRLNDAGEIVYRTLGGREWWQNN
jgi:hypothetical protein